jgi:hypothetical protein
MMQILTKLRPPDCEGKVSETERFPECFQTAALYPQRSETFLASSVRGSVRSGIPDPASNGEICHFQHQIINNNLQFINTFPD